MARKNTNTYCTGGISVANKNKNSIEVIWYGINADQKIQYLDWFAIGI